MTATPTAATPEELAAALAEATASFHKTGLKNGLATWAYQHGPAILATTEAQRAEIERLTKEAQELSAAHYDAAEGISATLASDALEAAEARATTAEAALADLLRLTGQTDATKAVAVVAAMLAGADHGSYGSVAREYAKCKAALAAVTAERDRVFGNVGKMREAGERALAASLERERGMRDALEKPGILLFLDGRNEHGSHVTPLGMQTIDIAGADEDLAEAAEQIIKSAEDAGYPIGSAIWCEFSRFSGQYDGEGRCEFEPCIEFAGVNLLMTQFFGWHAEAGRAALAAKEITDGR